VPRRVIQRRCDPSLILPSSRYLIRDGRDVSNYAPTVGKDPSLCCFPADWRCVLQIIQYGPVLVLTNRTQFSLSTADGAVWPESFPRHTLASKSILIRQGSPNLYIHLKVRPDQTCTFIEELPVRLAHRVKELDELPHHLSEMPSIIKVKEWYAQSFEVFALHFLKSQLFSRIESSLHYNTIIGTHHLSSIHPTSRIAGGPIYRCEQELGRPTAPGSCPKPKHA
jgi:hypothetical protein